MSEEPAEESKQKDAPPPPPSPFPGRNEPNLPPHLREKVEKSEQSGVAKTKIDYEAVTEVVIQTVSRKEVEVAEMMSNPDTSPAKPFVPIEKFETATVCSAKTNKKDRVGFCEKCKLRYYDFSGMELPQAEELIFKMEGIEKPKLFKRSDGKFLTRDCPVGRRKRLNKILAIGGGLFIIVFALVLFMINPRPQEPAPAANSSKEDNSSKGKNSETSKAATEAPKKGSKHRVYSHGRFMDVD
ncbi:MAG: hypothetical protein K2X27_01175 [Candidatus Obscuribacterales bacterium]|nr:hypothetical protein [Candidatus Obscuribacterales bacterium]